MEGRILTCVYCGMEYPQGTPASGDQVLTDHIRICSKHPLRKAEATISKLRGALVGLVGADDKKELEGMEAMTRTFRAMGNIPDKDATSTLNAIHALLDTIEDGAAGAGVTGGTCPQQAQAKTVTPCLHEHQTKYPSGERVCNDCGDLLYA